ncbi:MAG: ACT domain-containing protein [Candidatus Sumerlaeia bacterium]|nr:ACT domain-containing protein [Candidatus Sumerlaeia bacterium]
MKIIQLSVFLENTAGRLREVTGILSRAGINIRALSLAETADFGILRLIVSDAKKALEVLRTANFTVRETPILAVEVPDQPGGLHGLLEALAEAGMNIEYVYGFVEKRSDNAIIVIRVEEPDRAIAVLQAKGFTVLGNREIGTL